MKRFTTIAAAIVVPTMIMAVSVPPVFAASSKSSQSQRGAMSPEKFARQAAISDAFELEASRLAVQRAQNANVKTFAQHMVDDHTKTTTELSSIMPTLGASQTASSMGTSSRSTQAQQNKVSGQLTSPEQRSMSGGPTATTNPATTGSTATSTSAGAAMPALDQKHAQMLSRLRNASDAEFDRLYVQQQVSAHAEAVAMFRSYSRSGRNADLKEFATENLPTLMEHERDARQLQGSVRRTS